MATLSASAGLGRTPAGCCVPGRGGAQIGWGAGPGKVGGDGLGQDDLCTAAFWRPWSSVRGTDFSVVCLGRQSSWGGAGRSLEASSRTLSSEACPSLLTRWLCPSDFNGALAKRGQLRECTCERDSHCLCPSLVCQKDVKQGSTQTNV